MKKNLHLLWSGGIGGIERLCLSIGQLKPQNHIFWYVNKGGEVYQKMRREGIEAKLLSYDNYDIFKLYKLIIDEFKHNRINAIIVHHDSLMLWLMCILIKICHPLYKVYIYAHSDYDYFIPNSGLKKYIFRGTFRITAKYSDMVIAISNSVKNSIIKKGKIKSCFIEVVYNGIPLEQFPYVIRSHNEDSLKIVFVGRLLEEKGLHILLEAIQKSINKTNIYCTIVGDGVYRNNLERIVNSYGMQDRIIFVGSQINVYPYLENADVFIHPALCEEGFGITLVEAMSTGLPCIAFNKGAVPEIIDDGKNGIIVRKTTSVQLSKAIDKTIILNKNGQLRVMGKEARVKAEEFSCQSMIIKLEKFLYGNGI